jgi:cysteine desulfurase
MSDRIYLDWNATGPLLPKVRQQMQEALERLPGNASSIHQDGQRARSEVERARRALAEAVGAPAQAVVLTGGATESNNQVLRSHVRRTDDPRVVCTAVEHPSVLEVVEHLGEEGVEVDIVRVDGRGQPDLEALRTSLREGATLVSAMWANNETGAVLPVHEIGDLAAEHGAVFHVDATQALGRIPVDFQELGVDFMTLSAHKMGGPKGIGAVVCREGKKVGPLMVGGHQERGRRPGTENVPAAVGLRAAAEAVSERIEAWNQALEERRSILWEALQQSPVPVEVRGDPERRLPNTLNVAFDGVDGEDMLLALDLEGISASSGSACTAGSLEPSHVILAMGYPEPDARESVRFSFGPTTDRDAIKEASDRILRVADRLHGLA